jgi:ABC-2 type transport system permease protein
MNLRHIRLIIKREYMERLRSPGFIIGTVLGIVGIAALAFLPQLLSLLDRDNAQKIAIVDSRNLIYPYLPVSSGSATPQAQAPDPTGGTPSLTTQLQFLRADTHDPEELSQQVRDGKIAGYVTVEGERASNARLTLHAKDRPSPVTNSRLLLLLTTAATQAKIQESGMTPEQAAALFAPPQYSVEPIVGGALKDEQEAFQSIALVYVLLILLYGTIVMYGIQVATGVVYEKSSRVMEILLTSVRPIELMIGKVLGNGLLGLTQYALWVGIGFVGLVLSGFLTNTEGPSVDLAAIPAATLIYFLVFFVLGYLVYAALYAALGSLVNRIEEVNSITTPLTLILVSTYLLSLLALGNPDTDLIRWLSYVPFLTPMLMFIRVALGTPAFWEPLLAVVIMAASILLFAWIAAKIYRVGVLLYGKRPSMREIGRLLRAA